MIMMLDGQTERLPALQKAEMRSHCIGRYMVDLPKDFDAVAGFTGSIEPSGGNDLETRIEIQTVAIGLDRRGFEAAMMQRRQELAADSFGHTNTLEDVFNGPSGSVLFRILRIKDAYLGEIDTLIDGTHVRMTANSYHGTFQRVEKELFVFLSRLVPTRFAGPDDFCAGTFSIKGANTVEMAEFAYRSVQRPDVFIKVQTDTFAPYSATPLLSRINGADSLLKLFDIRHRVLRQGYVTAAGMRAQEWLGAARLEEDGPVEYKFSLETLGTAYGSIGPSILVDLTSGKIHGRGEKSANPLREASALQIWDAVIGSLRPQARMQAAGTSS